MTPDQAEIQILWAEIRRRHISVNDMDLNRRIKEARQKATDVTA